MWYGKSDGKNQRSATFDLRRAVDLVCDGNDCLCREAECLNILDRMLTERHIVEISKNKICTTKAYRFSLFSLLRYLSVLR